MITISLCMIVKNEERVLKRCLDSVRDLVDEIIIVDTGSTDATKRIAAGYTDKIYDLTWNDDFSAARNFAFSKATKEYIYSADADEVLSEENRRRFRLLKETLLPEIEIVQMKYGNQLQNGTVYNFDEEYRPKLFRRQRSFVWEEPIHETVRFVCQRTVPGWSGQGFPGGRELFSDAGGFTGQKYGRDHGRLLCGSKSGKTAGRCGELFQIHLEGDRRRRLLGDLLRIGAFL